MSKDVRGDRYGPPDYEGFLGEGLTFPPGAELPDDIPPFPESEDDVKVPVSVRMSTSAYEELKVIAAQHGMAPSTLAREWVEAQIAAHRSGEMAGVIPLQPLLEFIRIHRLAS